MKHTPVTVVTDAQCLLGEGPLWDAKKRCLYWTDINAGKLFCYDDVTKELTVIYEGESVGGFTIQESGDLLLFRVNDIALFSKGDVSSLQKFSEPGMRRFNDVIADPRGRVFAGTLGEHPKCGLYRIDLDGTITKLFAGTGCSNGMGFSPDAKWFYWTNTTTRQILQFDFAADSGALSNPRVFYETKPEEGVPDGLTVDAEGCVWSARWGGSRLVRHAATGQVLDELKIPARNVTSLCFGGENMNEIFITAAKAEGDQEGANMFRTCLEISGRSDFRSRVSFGCKERR